MTSSTTGTLFVVATPIGNAADLSPRALEVLQSVDVVAAEDTRTTRRLLAHFGLRAQLLSCHDHNEEARVPRILGQLRKGLDVAIVSDAGTPLISDPGFLLVRSAAARGVRVTAVPGPSALSAAMSISGLPTNRVLFIGFLPARRGKRRSSIEELARQTATLVFFEAPRRIRETLGDLQSGLGDRPAMLARNLTKRGETVLRGRLTEILDALVEQDLEGGEMTLVIDGCRDVSSRVWPPEASQAARRLLAEGLAPRVVRDVLSDLLNINRRLAYQQILDLSGTPEASAEQAGEG